jgi:hypothetical protein
VEAVESRRSGPDLAIVSKNHREGKDIPGKISHFAKRQEKANSPLIRAN